jgi:hypothetical protein
VKQLTSEVATTRQLSIAPLCRSVCSPAQYNHLHLRNIADMASAPDGVPPDLSFRKRATAARRTRPRRLSTSPDDKEASAPSGLKSASAHSPLESSRSVLSGRRRPRPRRRSDDDDGGDGLRRVTALARRRVAQPAELPGYDDDVKLEDKEPLSELVAADYSAEGLARLARATSSAHTRIGSSHDDVVMHDVSSLPPASVFTPASASATAHVRNSGILTRDLSHMERVLGARAGSHEDPMHHEAQRTTTGPGIAARTYISLDPSKPLTPIVLEGNAALDASTELRLRRHDSGDVDFAVNDDSDGSAGSAWEVEQLRRAGLDMRTSAGAVSLASSRALAIIEEEGEFRGGRGEIGPSVVDTCVENVKARVSVGKEKAERLREEAAAMDAAQGRGETEMHAVKAAARDAASRCLFYGSLAEFVDDVTEMLKETMEDTIASVNADIDRLREFAKRRFSTVDEFGRFCRQMDVSSNDDGYETPVVGANNEVMHATMNGTEDDETNADPLSHVSTEFKSLQLIAGRFAEWRSKYSKDYGAAYGDLLVGKLCGSVALASGLSRNLNWLTSLPPGAAGAALIKSRSVPSTALRIAASWEPQSHRSSVEHGEAARLILENLAAHDEETQAAKKSLCQAALSVLNWKVESINSITRIGPKECKWTTRAFTKCARCATIFAILVRASLSDVKEVEDEIENVVVCKMFGSIAARSDQSDHGRDDLLFAIENGCLDPDDINAIMPSVPFDLKEVPSRHHNGWAPARQALKRMRQQATIQADSKSLQRINAALQRIGA